MARPELAVIEAALERVAVSLGDITPFVMRSFYARFPEAQASFAEHQPHNPSRLEAEMVANALYCIMVWHERRLEIEIILQTSVPHHQETLAVPETWYWGLLDATISVIMEGAGTMAEVEREIWNDMRAGLRMQIERP